MGSLVETDCIIILARKGSKRLPRKNHYPVGGRPLYEYTFDFVEKLGSPVYVISDDYKLLKQAYECGFTGIEEPAEYATAEGGNMELMRWVHNQIKRDIYFMFPVTCPVRDGSIIKSAIVNFLFENHKRTSILTVKRDRIKDRYVYTENGSFYGWHKNQLELNFIHDENSILVQDKYFFDINDIGDINVVEAYIGSKK